MKFTFWCYAPAVLLLIVGFVLEQVFGVPQAQTRAAKHLHKFGAIEPTPPMTLGGLLAGIGGLMLFPATGLVFFYWVVRVFRRASRDSDKGRIT